MTFKKPFEYNLTDKDILTFLKSQEEATHKREIAKAFSIKGGEARIALKKHLRKLSNEGQINKTKYGYIIPEKDAPKQPQQKISLQNKDKETVLGYVEKMASELHLIPINKRDNRKFIIQQKNASIDSNIKVDSNVRAAKIGDFCLAEILPSHNQKRNIPVKIIQVHANISQNPHLSDLAIAEQDIPHVFSPDVLEQANNIKEITKDDCGQHRADLTHIPFITIDGEDAKDFDDAVWVKKNKNSFTLKVAIADVAYYVPFNSPLDIEAYKRGNSVYFPDCVVPMLPERLSNNLCSLRPQEHKAAFVVTLQIDQNGHVHEYHFERALICSVARTTYNQVQEAFDHEQDINNKITFKYLKDLYSVYKALLENRIARDALEIDRIEYKVLPITASRKIPEIQQVTRLDSHCLIEEFMIAANVAAARAIDKAKIPGFYRVHDHPTADKVFNLQTLTQALKLNKRKVPSQISAAFFNDFMSAYQDDPQFHLVQDLVLRTQSQAQYRRANIGHFGLSLTHYSHFTSPIRRYSDLIVHRLLIRIFELDKNITTYSQDQLDEIGTHLCITERRAVQAERDTQYRYMAQYLEYHQKTNFLGYIMGVSKYGLFVFLPDIGTEGFLPKRLFPHERFRFYEAQQKFVGLNSGRSFQIGQKIAVKILETNVVRGQILLTLDIKNIENQPLPKKKYKKERSHKRKTRRRS